MGAADRNVVQEVLPEFQEELLGLPYPVTILNAVVVRKDSTTGEVLGHAIPDLEGLAAAVAMVRLLIPVKLGPEEIKFVRKTLDMPAKRLAEDLNVDPSTYSRWENGSQVPGEYVERLLRIYACEVLKLHAPAVNYEASMITSMRVLAAWPEGQMPHIVIARVAYKDRDSRETTHQWDQAQEAA